MESISTLAILLILNSIFLIGLILNQNDNTKDSISTQKSSSLTNPLEKITWFSLILQLNLLLIKIKLNDF